MEASYSVLELSKELAVKEKELALASARAEEVLKEVSIGVIYYSAIYLQAIPTKSEVF